MNVQLSILMLAFVATAHSSAIKQLISRRTDLSDSTGVGIYDGSKTTVKSYPYIAAVLMDEQFFCEATIVSKQWVVTTGDCVLDVSPSEVTIVAGTNNGIDGKKFKVDKIVTHPKYNQADFDYEYACVKTDKEFKFSDTIQPIKLSSKTPKPKTNMVIAGYGSSTSMEVDDEPNNTLLQGNMTWLPKKKCAALYKPLGVQWTDRMACAYNKGKTTLCSGDWANAFVNNGNFYGMFVAGATSGWCSSEAMPILLSDVTSVADWIQKTTGAKIEDV